MIKCSCVMKIQIPHNQARVVVGSVAHGERQCSYHTGYIPPIAVTLDGGSPTPGVEELGPVALMCSCGRWNLASMRELLVAGVTHRRGLACLPSEEVAFAEVTLPDGVVDGAVLEQLINLTFDNIRELNRTKGREYASDVDALANFKRRADELDLSPFQVWGIFFGKHSDAIYAYLRAGKTLSEPIEGRIDDAILYLLLLKGLILERTHLGDS